MLKQRKHLGNEGKRLAKRNTKRVIGNKIK